MFTMKYRFNPIVLIAIPVFGLVLDAGTGMDDYFILSFSVSFVLVYAYLLRELHSKCEYVLKKHMARALLTLVAVSSSLICIAYFGYLNDPNLLKTVSRGSAIRYQYHYWTFGVFFLMHGMFFLYLLIFFTFKVLTGKVR